MNCANHPETPTAAYCQFCGKPLCAACIHKINGIVGCEPCLAARIGVPIPNNPLDAQVVHFTQTAQEQEFSDGQGTRFRQGPGYQRVSVGTVPPQATWEPEPWVAFVLGWIPGVGAMYNGQLAKAMAHVVIFALLIDLTHINGLLGIVVAAWVLYQVFDAYQTAIARRAGLPLPNPLGLNNIGQWFSGRSQPPFASPRQWNGSPANPGSVNPGAASDIPTPGMAEAAPISDFAAHYAPPYGAPPTPPIPPVPPNQCDMPDLWRHGGRGIPTGAVVMIVLGVAFLLGNLGILSARWMDRGWPILLIALGVWLVVRRSQSPPMGGVR